MKQNYFTGQCYLRCFALIFLLFIKLILILTKMNSLKNNIQLIGRLGKDPEIIHLTSGKTLAKVSVATNEYYRDAKGEKQSSTSWHNCIAWGKTAQIMENLLKKGKEVAIRGKLTYNHFEDKNGIKRYLPQVVVNEFVLIR
ncbi:MAG: single-stranded DNA-binding protein [Saprospiraceae bacterium]|nr:single-stranded DNA-binding protein [Saprospiraceae bacterium]